MFMLLFLFIMLGAFTKSAEAASKPKAKVTKVTLYTGYKSHSIKFSNLSKSAKVTYKSGNKKIATVSGKGVITPKAVGKTTVTATIKQNKKTYTSKIQVAVKKPYVSIIDIPKEFVENSTYSLKSKIEGIKKPSLSWS